MNIRDIFRPNDAQDRPDVESVRLLNLVATFARSAIIAAHPELKDDALDDDDRDPDALDIRIAGLCLEVIALVGNVNCLYENTYGHRRWSRLKDLPF